VFRHFDQDIAVKDTIGRIFWMFTNTSILCRAFHWSPHCSRTNLHPQLNQLCTLKIKHTLL